MNPFRNSAGGLNEILFENRNQNYGAYKIRQSYNSTVFKSIGITAGIFILGFWAISLAVNTEVEAPTDTGSNTPPDISVVYNVPKPKPLTNVAKPISQPVSKPVSLAIIGTLIKDSVEKTVLTVINTNLQSTGTSSLNVTSTIPGTGTATAYVEPSNTLTANGSQVELGPDVLPEMVGLAKFLQSNLIYPYDARENRISGKVWVNFIVDEQGKIIDAKILKGVGFGCDEEALRVIKLMPRWKPGSLKGRPVKVSFNQPIIFTM
jgi:protein TonB